MEKLTIIKPDDWHHHFRNGEKLKSIAPLVSKQFSRAIAMPNLIPPVVNTEMALLYKKEICDALPENSKLEPLMTLYLTDNTTPEEIEKAVKNGIVACKLYAAGVTTNSDSGVTNMDLIKPTLQAMSDNGMLLLIHGEVTDQDTDIFDRERLFIERKMKNIVASFPNLKIVMEHITTKDAVDFVSSAPPNVAATITCHHLLYNRNALFKGGVRPHYFCLPVLKRELHREALLGAIKSGNPKFFIGTDSAPHGERTKENCCGCAGVFTGHAAIELYTEAFESVDALDKLENFMSVYGPQFYGLPINEEKITLIKKPFEVPAAYKFVKNDNLIPLRAGETIAWSIVSEEEKY